MNKDLKNKLMIAVGIVGIAVLLVFFKGRQIRLSRALTPSKVGDIKIETEVVESGMQKAKIYFRTGTNIENAEVISTIILKIVATGSDDLILVDEEEHEIANIEPSESLHGSGEWIFPVNQISYSDEGVVIEFAAVNITPQGYKAGGYSELGSFLFSGSGESPVSFNFDRESSHIYSKGRPVTDIWR